MGKTTLAQACRPGRTFVTLDDIGGLGQARSDPDSLLASRPLTLDEARRLWFAGYVQTYLERDLRQLSAVSSSPDFQRLMAITANRTGRLVNQSEIARDAGLAQATAHRYLNLIETGCLITRLSPYTTNPTTGLVKAKKLFWSDSGLAAWLAGIRNPAQLAERIDLGFCRFDIFGHGCSTICSTTFLGF